MKLMTLESGLVSQLGNDVGVEQPAPHSLIFYTLDLIKAQPVRWLEEVVTKKNTRTLLDMNRGKARVS